MRLIRAFGLAGSRFEYEGEGANYIVGKGGAGSAIRRTGGNNTMNFFPATNGGNAIILKAPITFSGALTIGGGGGGSGWSYAGIGTMGGAVIQLADTVAVARG